MIQVIDPRGSDVAARIVTIQRSAYAVEASLIGFDGIPQLVETVDDVMALANMSWRGAFVNTSMAGIIEWQVEAEVVDIDRLAVDPRFTGKGHGRRLVQAVPTDQMIIVSSGTDNAPAYGLYLSEGFRPAGKTEVAPGVFTTQFSRPVGEKRPEPDQR